MPQIKKNRRQAIIGMGAMASLGSVFASAVSASSLTSSATAIPFVVPQKIANAAALISPSNVDIKGWLGKRIDANTQNRLLNLDIKPIISGFQKKPGSHDWIGEHIGKWMHAATLAWANTGNPQLRTKLDVVVAQLIKTQEADGYLGTYLPDKRFQLTEGANWDVWSHKYCLMGLITYYQYTGNKTALDAAQKAADLLISTFPAKRSILNAGHHKGMAATSVLEPIVLLYRVTGEPRYLDFAHYIVKSWDEEGGPSIVKTLLSEKKVRKVGNGKAYEMLSNIVGMCDLARVTGDQSLIEASLIAWQDIVDTQMFITGTASTWEYFQTDHSMRSDKMAHVGETCVTTTWIQFNLSLLQLTGEARFGDELERTFYNHLSAAQHPQGEKWCYFTALEGRKHYDSDITCCHSSGPRGMALSPLSAYLTSKQDNDDMALISTFESSNAALSLGGQEVKIVQSSGFPNQGRSKLTLHMKSASRFGLKIRTPNWASPMRVSGAHLKDGWSVIEPRLWQDGDVIDVDFALKPRQITGKNYNQGQAALGYGPFVLAYEQEANPHLAPSYRLGLTKAPMLTKANVSRQVTKQSVRNRALNFNTSVLALGETTPHPAKFTTFADAGQNGGNIRVWFLAPEAKTAPKTQSVLVGGKESQSRLGDIRGSINDEDYETLVTTKDGQYAEEDWFAIEIAKPVLINRIVFMHGQNDHDGGWFDTSANKPQIQIKRSPQSDWETIADLEKYPQTTASNAGVLSQSWMGYEFTHRLKDPVSAVAVRVLGRPSCGDTLMQNHVTCTQLQAFST